MAKLTVSNILAKFSSITKLNSNFAAIATAFENTLSRDGTAPNEMEADLDMNSNRILNLPTAVASTEAISLGQAQSLSGGGGAVSSVFGRTGAVVAATNDYDADEIDDAATTNKFTTAADISKLAGIESGATADQSDAEIETAYNNQVGQVSGGEKTAGTETAIRRFAPKDIADMAGTHGGGGGAVSSVFGRTGAVVAVANDYDADEIDDTSTTNKFTTAGDISKLAGIESGATADQSDAEIETAYNNQVAQVSGAERTAGTETAIRRFAPADIASMAGTHGSGSGLFSASDTTTAPATGDLLHFQDISDSNNPKKATISDVLALGGGSGVWEEVTTALTTPTSNAFTFTSLTLSTYTKVVIILEALTSTTAADDGDDALRLTLYTGGTEQTGATDYQYHVEAKVTTGTEADTSSTGDSALFIQRAAASYGLDDATDSATYGEIVLYDPGNTTKHKVVTADLVMSETNTGSCIRSNTHGTWQNTGAIDGFKIAVVDNMNAGSARVFGLLK